MKANDIEDMAMKTYPWSLNAMAARQVLRAKIAAKFEEMDIEVCGSHDESIQHSVDETLDVIMKCVEESA